MTGHPSLTFSKFGVWRRVEELQKPNFRVADDPGVTRKHYGVDRGWIFTAAPDAALAICEITESLAASSAVERKPHIMPGNAQRDRRPTREKFGPALQ